MTRLGGVTAAVATAGVVVALDQITKQVADTNVERGGEVSVFPASRSRTRAIAASRSGSSRMAA